MLSPQFKKPLMAYLSKKFTWFTNLPRRKRMSLLTLLFFSFSLSLLFIFLNFGASYPELQKITQEPNTQILAFTSDGCSGGMSSLWRAFHRQDSSQERTDQHLPWLACCLAHDESYWRGGSEQQRLDSDVALKQCVKKKGYPKTASLMYAAVRLGGGPCTGFSWRWGYGWKDC